MRVLILGEEEDSGAVGGGVKGRGGRGKGCEHNRSPVSAGTFSALVSWAFFPVFLTLEHPP